MARRVKTTTVKEELPEPEAIPLSQVDSPQQIDLSEESESFSDILSQFGESPITIRVSKANNIDGRMEYLTKVNRAEVEDIEEYLQTQYGGGKYSLKIYNANVLIANITLRIANRPANNTIVQSSADSHLTNQILFLQNMILKMIERTNGNGNSHTPVSELAEALVKLREINPPSTSSELSAEKVFDLITKGMDIAGKASGKFDWKSELFTTIKEIAPQVVQTIQTIKPPVNGVPLITPTQQIPASVELPSEDVIKKGIAKLKESIMRGLHVDLASDWILNNIDDPYYKQLVAMALSSPVEKLLELDADLVNEPYKSWITQLHSNIKKAWEEQEETEEK